MIKVLVESPYAGDVEKNLRYLRKCMRDCFQRGEAPFASHGLYTQPGVLDDLNPEERALGIDAGLLWGACAEKTVVYTDLGMSRGMQYGIQNAEKAGRPIEYRSFSYEEETPTTRPCGCEGKFKKVVKEDGSVTPAITLELIIDKFCSDKCERSFW